MRWLLTKIALCLPATFVAGLVHEEEEEERGGRVVVGTGKCVGCVRRASALSSARFC